MANEAIREAAKKENVKLWEIAERYGVVDSTFSRQLRREFSDSKKQLILELIDQIATEREVSE